jgi:hypothetical protein
LRLGSGHGAAPPSFDSAPSLLSFSLRFGLLAIALLRRLSCRYRNHNLLLLMALILFLRRQRSNLYVLIVRAW